MKIEVWSDVMCPFCYIGKTRLDQALEQIPNWRDRVEVEWKSFQLDPEFKPVKGEDVHKMLAAKKGWTYEYAREMNNSVAEMGRSAGLTYNMDKVVPANTFDALRLIKLADTYQKSHDAQGLLFKAMFTEGGDVGHVETLVSIGKNLGLDETEVRMMLASNRFADEVRADGQEAAQLGARGVPFFVFNRKYAISGAQSPEVFAGTLHKALTEWESDTGGLILEEGKICSPEGQCE